MTVLTYCQPGGKVLHHGMFTRSFLLVKGRGSLCCDAFVSGELHSLVRIMLWISLVKIGCLALTLARM